MRRKLVLLILIISLIIVNAKEEFNLRNLFRNARAQTRHQVDRNYFAINHKSPYICEFSANCDDQMTFSNLFN